MHRIGIVPDGRATTRGPYEFLTFIAAGRFRLEVTEQERKSCVF